jgi:hypothetical protein
MLYLMVFVLCLKNSVAEPAGRIVLPSGSQSRNILTVKQ